MLHLLEARRGSLPLLMVTDGLGGAGCPTVTGGRPFPGTRPFALPGAGKLAGGVALLLGYVCMVPFPAIQKHSNESGLLLRMSWSMVFICCRMDLYTITAYTWGLCHD